MEYIKSYLKDNIILIIIIGILILTNICSVGYFLYNNQFQECICEECEMVEVSEQEVLTSKIKVDIKGYVNAPGVYELPSGSIINDLIILAGGLKTNGTTDNINLSKELNNEDMIVVLSKSELKNLNTQNTSTVNSSSTSTTSTTSSSSSNTTNTTSATSNSTQSNSSSTNSIEAQKISLNTATKEELMTLNGIGEAKALSIIEYRSTTPFTDISEIMNVSGIGESIYEKIKDDITI